VRGLLVALALLLSAGCGAEERSSGGSAATAEPGESAPAPTVAEADAEEPTKPPRIVLVSGAGRQAAVRGSYCVDDPARGVGVCADIAPMTPEELSVVRPGETVAISLGGAEVTSGGITIRTLACEKRPADELELPPGETARFPLDLPPGQYELLVFVTFEAADGRSGDVSGSLGLLVDERAPQEIVPLPDAFVGC
jgi:hypothetical protein